LLGPEAAAAERIAVWAKSPTERNKLEKMAGEFSKLSAAEGLQIVQRLRWSNANAYTYMIQMRLREFGLYNGSLTGQLNKSTVAAFAKACAAAGHAGACDKGPLSPEAADVISVYLFNTVNLEAG
jgi:hypothetical protein